MWVFQVMLLVLMWFLRGPAADSRAMVYRAREKAAKFQHDNAFAIPVHYLATKIANINQIFTQHAYMRLHACGEMALVANSRMTRSTVGILIGIDEDSKEPKIYKFDPAGWYTGNRVSPVRVNMPAILPPT